MKSILKSVIIPLLLIPLILSLTPRLFAQSADTGAIFGTVSDNMSAVLPEAKVTLTDERTSVVRSHETNGSGFYDFEALPSSEYTVVIQRDGFKSATTLHVLVNPGQRRDVSTQMTVGSISTIL